MGTRRAGGGMTGPINSDQKACNRCWKVLPLSDFHPGHGKCRKCWRKASEASRRANMKGCSGCGLRRNKSLFETLERGSRCAHCRGTYVEPAKPAEKACTICKEVKPLEDFSKTRGYHRGDCRSCHNRHRAERRWCNGCKTKRPRYTFGEGRWKRPVGDPLRHTCTRCKPTGLTGPQKNDATYDFNFALDVMDMTESQAVRWVIDGYKLTGEPYDLLIAFRAGRRHWEPDRLEAL